MIDLLTISQLFMTLSDTHHDLGAQYANLAAALDPAHVAGNDAITLARAIQGEEAGQFGDKREELGILIAHTQMNRWAKPYWNQVEGFPCLFSEHVEYYWHGTDAVKEEDVEPWALNIAHSVMLERRNGGPDLAEGALFAATVDDLDHLGVTDQVNDDVVKMVISDETDAVFWFFTVWPTAPDDDSDQHTDHY